MISRTKTEISSEFTGSNRVEQGPNERTKFAHYESALIFTQIADSLTNCRINDRVISANNVSLEGVDYATAVQVLFQKITLQNSKRYFTAEIEK